jgi:hypothetical protein
MPLTRGPRAHTVHQEGVNFTMLAPDGSAVPCHVERSALDALVGGMGQLLPTQQAPVFTARRPEIECVASRKYDCGQLKNGIAFVGFQDVGEA